MFIPLGSQRGARSLSQRKQESHDVKQLLAYSCKQDRMTLQSKLSSPFVFPGLDSAAIVRLFPTDHSVSKLT